jgi:hypothetical protein
MATVDRALEWATPIIWNSDQGAQFASTGSASATRCDWSARCLCPPGDAASMAPRTQYTLTVQTGTPTNDQGTVLYLPLIAR